MSQRIFCDECGANDDWIMDKEAFFPGGARLFLRSENGSEGGRNFDLCPSCTERLLESFPKIAEASSQ